MHIVKIQETSSYKINLLFPWSQIQVLKIITVIPLNMLITILTLINQFSLTYYPIFSLFIPPPSILLHILFFHGFFYELFQSLKLLAANHFTQYRQINFPEAHLINIMTMSLFQHFCCLSPPLSK